MRTPRLPAVDWTDAPTDLNGLVRFGERRNLVSALVPTHFKRSLWGSVWLVRTVESKAYLREYNVVGVRWCMYSCNCTWNYIGKMNGLNKIMSLQRLNNWEPNIFNEHHRGLGWGSGYGTALLVGRSRDRFPVVSLGIFSRGSRRNHVPWDRDVNRDCSAASEGIDPA